MKRRATLQFERSFSSSLRGPMTAPPRSPYQEPQKHQPVDVQPSYPWVPPAHPIPETPNPSPAHPDSAIRTASLQRYPSTGSPAQHAAGASTARVGARKSRCTRGISEGHMRAGRALARREWRATIPRWWPCRGGPAPSRRRLGGAVRSGELGERARFLAVRGAGC